RRAVRKYAVPDAATAMDLFPLTALSPLDGRYAGAGDSLRPILSEYGLIRARVKVEVEWLLALAASPDIAELPPFPPAPAGRLRAIADGFSVADAAEVKEIERTTNHDVKAVEDFIKRRMADDAEVRPAMECVHLSCTSEAATGLAYALTPRQARAAGLLPPLRGIIDHLRGPAHEHAARPTPSPPPGQTASPTTLGKEPANV